MFTYRNENAFSKALVEALKKKGAFVQRIESGLTGRGIPDLYCIIRKDAVWIELKRVHHKATHFESIPWRPGQQSWLTDVYERGQRVLTFCCFNDMICCITHERTYMQNVVDISSCDCFFSLKDLIKALYE